MGREKKINSKLSCRAKLVVKCDTFCFQNKWIEIEARGAPTETFEKQNRLM